MSKATATTKAKQRIYVVGTEERLVRAQTSIQARNHVAKQTIDVRLATQDDLIKLAASRKVEQAVEDVATIPLPLAANG